MTKHEERSERRRKERDLSIEGFIPPYLKRFIMPYHGDFCVTRTFHYRLVAQLMSEGFLPIATDGYLLPKLHVNRCVVTLPDNLHISKSVRKKSKRFTVSVNKAFDEVIAGCKKQHGRRCWLYPPLVEAFKTINQSDSVDTVVFENGASPSGRECPVRLYSIEVWNESTGQLAGGELGYTVGSVYTSLTGFSSEDSAGSVQLAALGRMLSSLGFKLWDLGMEMDYKNSLGCHLMPRKQFIETVAQVRESMGHLRLPTDRLQYNAKDLIDQNLDDSLVTSPGTAESDSTNVLQSQSQQPRKQQQQSQQDSRVASHQPPYDDKDCTKQEKKKIKKMKAEVSHPEDKQKYKSGRY